PSPGAATWPRSTRPWATWGAAWPPGGRPGRRPSASGRLAGRPVWARGRRPGAAPARFGSARWLHWLELERAAEHYWPGRWDRAVQVADSATTEAGDGARHFLEGECRIWRGRIRLARGEVAAALEDVERAIELARESGDRQNLDPALAFGARALLVAGRPADAGKLLDELPATPGGGQLKPGG